MAPATSALSDAERAIAELGDGARAFARTPPREKAALLRATLPRLVAAAPELAAAIASARGADPAGPGAAVAWLAGVVPVIAYVRLLAEALMDIAESGRPALPAASLYKRPDGRVAARLVARTWPERLAERETTVLFTEATEPEDAIAAQAAFYRQSEPEGGVALVLAADRDATAGVMDALFSLFVEGRAAIVARGPLLANAGAVLDAALAPLVERGFLRAVPDEAGEALAAHPGVSSVLRAPPRAEGALLVVPCLYAKAELDHLAKDVASQLACGAVTDVAAPRALVLPAGWAQRALFLEALEKALAAIPLRCAIVPELAAGAARDAGSLPAVAVGSDDPAEFLAAAARFCDERLGDVGSIRIAVHPIHEDDPELAAALDRAILRLRCGAIGVNRWPALLAWAAGPPWGGDPAAGVAFRHNARMLGRVDKVVLRGPLLGLRRPAYFAGASPRLGEALAAFHAAPRARGLLAALGALGR